MMSSKVAPLLAATLAAATPPKGFEVMKTLLKRQHDREPPPPAPTPTTESPENLNWESDTAA